jgi:HSP20 family protein
MGIKDLIPWNNGGREVAISRGADVNPFFTLHREMNRMFDDVFRGFDLAPLGSTPGTERAWLAPDRHRRDGQGSAHHR